MRSKRFLFALAALLTAAGILSACGRGEESSVDRKIRVLPDDFAYTVKTEGHTVEYADSQGREIALYGQLWRPETEGVYPAVILCHGFNGHFTDFLTECRRFASRGYVCYAFDFCGAQAGGKSTGRSASEYTPYTMVEDLSAAVENIGKLAYVDGKQIFLLGGSQGGFVAALAAAELKEEIAALAMYFPAFNIPDDWRTAPVRDTPLMGYSIGAEYIRSIRKLDPFAVIGAYGGDVCVVWGDRDALVLKKYIDGAVAAYGPERAELTVIPGAGHGFGGAALSAAVDKVCSFLEARTYES